jgi:ADP-heptose:LPS heptosyltransferase
VIILAQRLEKGTMMCAQYETSSLPKDDLIENRFRDHYATHDRIASILRFLVAIFAPLAQSQERVPLQPKRILLGNAGQLGDVIISTSLLRPLHETFPESEIDFITTSYARAAIVDNPLICRVHLLDHWASDRSDKNVLVKISNYYFWNFMKTRKALKALNYDIAVDLHAWFPNYIPLFWAAGIPVRVGFDRLGFGPMLTHCQQFVYDRRHEMAHMLSLLGIVGVPVEVRANAYPEMHDSSDDVRRRVSELLPMGRYHVLHPASSTPTRDWSVDKWASLAERLLDNNITPIVTGYGSRDAFISGQIAAITPGVVDTVGRFSWDELMAVVANAELVYSVETSVGHLAAALRRPVISIHGGMADPSRWAPVGSLIATKTLECSPCFDKRGCPHRNCILGVTVDDVWTLVERARSAGAVQESGVHTG